MSNQFFSLLILGTMLVLPRSTGGAVLPLSFEELTLRSSLIVTGKVAKLEASRVPFPGLGECLVTAVTLDIHSAFKGHPTSEQVVFHFLGGRLPVTTTDAAKGADKEGSGPNSPTWELCLESPRFEIGERVLVFLRRFQGTLWNTGWHQGKYRLSQDGQTVLGESSLPIANHLAVTTVARHVALFSRIPASAAPSSPSGQGPVPGSDPAFQPRQAPRAPAGTQVENDDR